MTPLYMSKATLAGALDCAESTVDEMVRRGVLPRPIHLSAGCVRWCWEDVHSALASLKPYGNTGPADPYAAGASNVTKIPESHRAPAPRRA